MFDSFCPFLVSAVAMLHSLTALKTVANLVLLSDAIGAAFIANGLLDALLDVLHDLNSDSNSISNHISNHTLNHSLSHSSTHNSTHNATHDSIHTSTHNSNSNSDSQSVTPQNASQYAAWLLLFVLGSLAAGGETAVESILDHPLCREVGEMVADRERGRGLKKEFVYFVSYLAESANETQVFDWSERES